MNELEAQQLALLAEEQELLREQDRLRDTPDDTAAYSEHLERLKAHNASMRAAFDVWSLTAGWMMPIHWPRPARYAPHPTWPPASRTRTFRSPSTSRVPSDADLS